MRINLSSYSLGLVFIFLVAVIWSAASVLVKYLYQNHDFDAPFLLTYIGTSLFTVLIPIHRLHERWCDTNRTDTAEYEHLATSPPSEGVDEGESHPVRNQTLPHRWTERDHMIAAAKIAPVWFISNFAYNTSLQYTSITSSTVLVNTGSLFAFLFALLMRDEHFSFWKLMGVLFGIGGTIITGLHDASSSGGDSHNEGDGRMLLLRRFLVDDDGFMLWGDILSVISAALYGVYAVMVRVLCPRDESLMSMQLLLGYVGVWNGLFLSPIIFWQLGIAKSVRISPFVLGCLLLNGLFDNVLSDYLWARSVVLTSATVATVGLGLSIPLAFVSDIFLGREDVLSIQSVGGALAVLTGFVLVNIGQQQEELEVDTYMSHLQASGIDHNPLRSDEVTNGHERNSLDADVDYQPTSHLSIETRPSQLL
jgi:solute carrier family 35 protein F5